MAFVIKNNYGVNHTNQSFCFLDIIVLYRSALSRYTRLTHSKMLVLLTALLTKEFDLDITVKSKPVLGVDDLLLLLNYH